MSINPAPAYRGLADMAREHARTAIHQGKPVAAREWIEAATAADDAAANLRVSDLRLIVREEVTAAFERWEHAAWVDRPE